MDNTAFTSAGTTQNPISSAISDINQEFKEREVQQKAREIGISYIDVSLVPINEDVLRLVEEEDSTSAQLIPFFRVGKKLRVAVCNPEKMETKRILELLEKQQFFLNINLCSEESLKKAQIAYKNIRQKDEQKENLEKQNIKNIDDIQEEIRSIVDLPKKMEEVRSDLALAFLHREAISMNVSDLHFEQRKDGSVRVRGRIDGMLRDFFVLSEKISSGIFRQIKFNAKIKSNMLGVPADGQYSFLAGDREIMVRVSILPQNGGKESFVMRFLDGNRQKKTVEDLGFLPFDLQKFDRFAEKKDGLILVTGPTGSGKTTTLYSFLEGLNTPEKKIITLEDPVEYEIDGIVQSSVDEEKGYGFADGLRSILRQDPDIILVGEIRDLETAETALRAAITGHLVLSTLHTNSAVESIVRLRDLHVSDYLIASALRGIVGQRLARKICPHCAEEEDYSDAEKKMLLGILKPFVDAGEEIPPVREKKRVAKGCKKCGNTGYKGRIVISEIVEIDSEMENAIANKASRFELEEISRKKNVHRFQHDAALKILQGKTTFDEIMRVLGGDFR